MVIRIACSTMISRLVFLAFFAFVNGEFSNYESSVRDYLEELEKRLYDVYKFNIPTVIRDDDEKMVFNFTSFPRIKNIFDYMDYLQSTHPEHIYVFDIGTTLEGLPLRVIRIGPSYTPVSKVWVDAGIHAREWITVSSVCFIMHTLAERWHELSAAMQDTEFFLLPVVNPDGFRHSYSKDRMWRKNRRFTGNCFGVDLNRNFPYMWGSTHFLIKDGKLEQKKPCNQVYEGPFPLSEPESRAIVNFITGTGRKFGAFLTFHSYGRKITYPYGYEPRVPKMGRVLHYIGTKAKYVIGNATGVSYDVQPLSVTEYVSPGNSIDWAYRSNISLTYLVELSDNSFINPVSDILPTGKEAFVILQTIVENLYISDDEINSIPSSMGNDATLFGEVVEEEE